MSVILLDKNKLNNLLKEDLTSGKYNPLNPYNQLSRDSDVDPTKITQNLGGDDAGSAKARSEYLRSKIEKNFSSLGIHSDLQAYMESQGIFTLELIQQYSQPFDFSFVKENGEKFSGKAVYNKQLSEKFKTLVLDFNEVKLKFTPDSLKRPFLAKKGMWGKYKDKMALMGLQTNGIFDVEVAGNLSSKSEETKEESDVEYNVGDEISFETDKGKKGKGKIVKIEGEDITVTDGKGNEIVINKKNIITDADTEEKGLNKEANYYNGKDLKEVNIKLSDVKDKAKFFSIVKQYKDDPEFQKIFLDAIINTTKSIKINQKPLLTTLKDLRSNGLLEEPEAMSGLKRKYLKVKLNLQNFMVEVFSLFAKVAKSGKQSKTFEVIKNFYKELFMIATKGKTSISDEQTRKQLWRKLMGSFSNFLKAMSRLPEMVKGGKKPDEEKKEVKVKNTPKANINTMESFIQDIANSIKLITEEEKGSLEKIKILKIGILQELKKGEEEEGGKKGKPMINDKKFIECKAELKFESDEDDTIFKKSIKKQIVDGLTTGKFFVRMSQKPKGLVLIFSKTENESGSFFTLAGKGIKSPKDPSQWKGEVVVGDKAMGNKDFKGTKAFIKNLVLSK